MKKYLLPAITSFALCTVSHFALASSDSPEASGAPAVSVGEPNAGASGMGGGDRRAKMKEKFENMNPEQQEKAKAHMAERKAKWNAMSPEEKAAHKAKKEERRAKWDAMSPEEKEAHKAKKEARHEKMKNMSPEERNAAREKWRENRKMKRGGEAPSAPAAN
jgi:hypothetical protein